MRVSHAKSKLYTMYTANWYAKEKGYLKMKREKKNERKREVK